MDLQNNFYVELRPNSLCDAGWEFGVQRRQNDQKREAVGLVWESSHVPFDLSHDDADSGVVGAARPSLATSGSCWFQWSVFLTKADLTRGDIDAGSITRRHGGWLLVGCQVV